MTMLPLRPVLLLTLILSTGGCAAIGALSKSATPLDAYELRGNLPRAAGQARSNLQIVVETPVVGAALDTDRMLIRPNRLQTQYLPESRWVDSPAKMVQSALVREIEATGAFRYVGRTPIGPGGDFAIVSEITDFQAEIGAEGGTLARLRISARIVREQDARIVSSQVFEATAPATGPDGPALAAALDAAMTDVMRRMTAWTVSVL